MWKTYSAACNCLHETDSVMDNNTNTLWVQWQRWSLTLFSKRHYRRFQCQGNIHTSHSKGRWHSSDGRLVLSAMLAFYRLKLCGGIQKKKAKLAVTYGKCIYRCKAAMKCLYLIMSQIFKHPQLKIKASFCHKVRKRIWKQWQHVVAWSKSYVQNKIVDGNGKNLQPSLIGQCYIHCIYTK